MVLISIAASLRLLAPFIAFPQELPLWLAVIAWSAAFLLKIQGVTIGKFKTIQEIVDFIDTWMLEE